MLWRVLFLSLCGLTGLRVYWYVWPVDVDISVVTERTIAREIVAPGVLKANRQVMITAKTAGFLSAVNVDRNDVVRPPLIAKQSGCAAAETPYNAHKVF